MTSIELRIGNYILNDLGAPFKVCTLTKGSVECEWDGGKGWQTVFRPRPIPLTPEWLEKFGFEKIQEGYFEYYVKKYLNNLKTVESKFKLSLEEMGDIESGYYSMAIWIGADSVVHIYNVHHLQNLYFALTGVELIPNDSV